MEAAEAKCLSRMSSGRKWRTSSHSPGNGGCFPHGSRGAMLELHLSLRTRSLRSWNDLRISFRETGTAVHMIFRQNFVVPGHWFSHKKVEIFWVRTLTVRETAFGCCCCCCWQPHGLLICNSWFFFKLNNTHQSEPLHSNVTLFRLVQYSKSFANVLLVSAVEGGALGCNHYWTPGIIQLMLQY